MGIGTTNPSARLQVVSSGGSKDVVRFSAADQSNNQTQINIRETLSGQLRMEVKDSAGQTVVQLHSDGPNYFDNGSAVGIGVANPFAQLDVVGRQPGLAMRVRRVGAGSPLFEIHEAGNGKGTLRMANAAGERVVQLNTDGLSYFNTGSTIGIGTKTPGADLEISSRKNNNLALKIAPSSAANYRHGMDIKESSGELEMRFFDANNDQQVRIAGDESFFAGRVGIGTASPSEQMEIAGNLRVTDTLKVGEGTIQMFSDVGQLGDFILATKEMRLNAGFFNLNSSGNILLNAPFQIGGITWPVNPNEGWPGFPPPSGLEYYVGVRTDNPQGAFDVQNDFVVEANGNVGIGSIDPTARLEIEAINSPYTRAIWVKAPNSGTNKDAANFAVYGNGYVYAKEIQVQLSNPFPDYVFREEYSLMPMSELQQFIEENGHLPNMPSAEEVEDEGIAVGEMQRKLLEKVEELTLYVLELNKENEELKRSLYKNDVINR